MTNSIPTQLKSALTTMGTFIINHSRMIYFVLATCIVIAAISGLNIALNPPSDETYRTEKLKEAQSTRFDTATIEKIQNLNARQQTNIDTLPVGQRTNPFNE